MKKKAIIIVFIAIILGIIFAGIKSFNYVKATKTIKTYDYNGMIVTSKVDPRIGGLVVKGPESTVIKDYVDLLIKPSYGHVDLNLTYQNEPNINEVNNLISIVGKNDKFYYTKNEEEVLTNIFNIIESSDNQDKNSEIIYKLVSNNSNLTYMNENQIIQVLKITSLKGEQLNEMIGFVINLKSIYLNGFNASPV
ncbi:MAG: hypothetical protein ACRC57_10820 [Sarcina sp.]